MVKARWLQMELGTLLEEPLGTSNDRKLEEVPGVTRDMTFCRSSSIQRIWNALDAMTTCWTV